MQHSPAGDPAALFNAVLHAHADRPLITWYDETPGRPARVELSARSVANWAAKTSGLLTDELGLAPGDRALVRLPAHWLTIGELAGIWNAGLEVVTSEGEAPSGDVAFVTTADTSDLAADEIFTVDPTSPLQLGGPDDALPGARDVPTALRPHPDRLGASRSEPDAPALDGRAGNDVVADAAGRATALGLDDGRWLMSWSDLAPLDTAAVIDAVLAPWTAGGGTVWAIGAPNTDRLAAIAIAESARIIPTS